MSKAKIIAIKIVVFLLIIAVVLTISYFFHGLMYDLIHKPAADIPPADIVEPEKPNNEDNSNVVAKELVSKTIVSEKYGTFDIPVNSMLLSNTTNNLIFSDSTDFNYIFDKEIEKLKDNKDITAESTFVFKCKRDNMLSDILNGTNINVPSGNCYFVIENQKIQYSFSDNLYEKIYPYLIYDSMTLAISLLNDEVTPYQEIDVNFYCKSLFLNETIEDYSGELTLELYFSNVIISDTGCPLTDYIFEEIMSDETTKIIYNYAE